MATIEGGGGRCNANCIHNDPEKEEEEATEAEDLVRITQWEEGEGGKNGYDSDWPPSIVVEA